MRVKKILIISLMILFILSSISRLISFIPGLNYSKFLDLPLIISILGLLFFWLLAKSKNNKVVSISFLISLIIIISIFGYGYYQNIYRFQRNTYLYDLGAKDEKSLLFSPLRPENRLSEKKIEYINDKDIINYREILHPLVYTDIKIPEEVEGFDFFLVFKEVLPRDEGDIFLRLKTSPESDFHQYKIFESGINFSLYDYIEENGLFLYYINPNATKYQSITEFKANLSDKITVGYDNQLLMKKINPNLTYYSGEFFTNNSLRGNHQLIIYAKGDLEIVFVKEDLNLYKGEDDLKVSLSNINGVIIKEKIIEDDGNVNDGQIKHPQQIVFEVRGLEEGIYFLDFEFSNTDSTFKNIRINQKNVVFDKYAFPLNEFQCYAEKGNFSFMTLHDNKIKPILINNTQNLFVLNLSEKKKEYSYEIREGTEVQINGQGDVVIDSNHFFSINKESYFEPFKFDLVDIDDLKNKKKSGLDYLLVNYHPITEEGWIKTMVSIPITPDLYFEKERLELSLNIPVLKSSQISNLPISMIAAKYHEQ